MDTMDALRPILKEPFPNESRFSKDEKTGLLIPKRYDENIVWRRNLLTRAEKDPMLQRDLLSACAESVNFFINAFMWTYHQFDVDEAGRRIEAKFPHQPFITWDIQDKLFQQFIACLFSTAKELEPLGRDILIDKARDMGASWCCVGLIHWVWLFIKDKQILEMSRTEDYVDKAGNMKALFQKHDYINQWLPEWMLPPDIGVGQKNRTKMHLKNAINGSCIDGESTTEHAGSGDRRFILLLDEFSKVKNGTDMRSATRDVAFMRIVNSTPFGAGTEYSQWKNSGQIRVFVLPYHEHPDKGRGRYLRKTETDEWEIRSPWFDAEEKVRSTKELAREVLRKDTESGDVFFSLGNVEKHKFLFAREPRWRLHVCLRPDISNDEVKEHIRRRNYGAIRATKGSKGPLAIWCELHLGRPDQSKSYIFGIDVGKGQGASESVVSIKCRETGEKIAEWRDANTPPYDMARIVVALALWCGGKNPRKLPFLKWENNGPGWDLGRQLVKTFFYPYYYRRVIPGKRNDKKTETYGFHTDQHSKCELLTAYDRALSHGGYINHSAKALEQVKLYVYYTDGGIGPAYLVRESSSARKTHGDIVIADALTIENDEVGKDKYEGPTAPEGSCGFRRDKIMKAHRDKRRFARSWRRPYDLRV